MRLVASAAAADAGGDAVPRWAGTLGVIAPSTAHQIYLDLRVGEPPGQYILEPPGFLLHLWRPGLGLVSHTILIEDFPGPYGFGG